MNVYDTLSDALYEEAMLLQQAPEFSPRGMKTKELIQHTFGIRYPEHRFTLNENRRANPFAQLAETIWTLSGRNDLDWLERYIPQCKQYSDDGKTWRAAYGPRLRKWLGNGSYDEELNKWTGDVDQIQYVIDKLKADPYSRQAVISLWDVAEDTFPGSKDYPCNDFLQFLVRDGYLYMIVVLRSNDIIYGFSHNDFFLWSILMEMIANELDVYMGTVQWEAGSFHVYERHYHMLGNLHPVHTRHYRIYMDVNLKEFDECAKELYDFIAYLPEAGFDPIFCERMYDKSLWFGAVYVMLAAHDMKLKGVPELEIVLFIDKYLGGSDMYHAAALYLLKDRYYELIL